MAYKLLTLHCVLIDALTNKWRLVWEDTNENVDGEVTYLIYKHWEQYPRNEEGETIVFPSDTHSFVDVVTEADARYHNYYIGAIYQVAMLVNGKAVAYSYEIEVPYYPINDSLIYTDRKHYNNIAKKIQELTGETNKYTPENMTDKITDVYNKGIEYKWDKIQNYGNRTFYPYFFAYDAYPHKILQAKHTILGTAEQNSATSIGGKYATNGGNSMFRQNGIIEQILTDIVITSKALYVFQSCRNLLKIQKITVDDEQPFTGWFEGDVKLVFIRWGGVIGQDLDMSSCPLDPESMADTIIHLQTGAGKTLKFSAACWQALELSDVPKPIINEETGERYDGSWKDYLNNIKGWRE